MNEKEKRKLEKEWAKTKPGGHELQWDGHPQGDRPRRGGAALAAECRALSADHLEYLDQAGVEAMAAIPLPKRSSSGSEAFCACRLVRTSEAEKRIVLKRRRCFMDVRKR